MSADQQLAIARAPRGESTHLSRTAAKVVPPFLQKLYEIVNDPKNDELIRWSDSGDSFYVLNHERFAREVLGRWFKHQKFTSFVRQLNMYGFHKIPHLQQGVLRSESDTEPWHFEHPHFHRGQPDLLCLIQRKKQPAHGAADDLGGDLNEPAATGVPNLTAGQLLDINSIMNGIAAIKRHQKAISADLNELKTSNQHLWQESLAARERHKKHQDTINRILKFLAGVFGNSPDAVKHDTSNPTHVMPRNRQRLMIGGGDIPEKRKTALMEEVDDDDDRQSVRSDSGRPAPLYATIEPAELVTTPQSPSSASVAASDAFGPTITDISSTYRPSPTPAIRPTETTSRSLSDAPHTTATNPPQTQFAKHDRERTPAQPSQSALMPVANMQAANGNGDWSNTLQGLLNSPAQLQRLMQALATQQNQPMHIPAIPTSETDYQTLDPRATTHQVATYDPNAYDFSRFRTELPAPTLPINHAQSAALAPSLLGPLSHTEDDDPALEPLMDNTSRLQKSDRNASAIEENVDALEYSLHSLINGLGLDPDNLDIPDETSASHLPTGHDAAMSLDTGMHMDSANEFDIDAFINELSRSNPEPAFPDVTSHFDPNTPLDGTTVGDASTDQLTAFLDDVSSASDSLNDPLELQSRPSKRKSDVLDLPPPLLSNDTVPQVKRKR